MGEDVIEKVLSYLVTTKDTPYRISKSTGISAMSIGRYIKGQSKPTPANAILLLQYFEGIPPKIKSNARLVNNEDVQFMNVVHVPVAARAGYLSGYGDEVFIGELPTIPVIVDKNYRGKYRVFDVDGDSMDDGTRLALYDNDKILCREVKQHLWRDKLHFNKYFFVIVHREEGILVKQIIDHDVDTGEITCHSLNPLYEDFKLTLNDVVELYNVIKIVDRNTRI